MLDSRVETGEAGRIGRAGDAVIGHLLEEIHVRAGLEPLARANRVAEEPQPPLGADPRVQLADAARGHVPRVGEQRLALGLLPFVEPRQIAVSHVDLTPRLENAGILLAAEPQGNVVNRADVVGHVVAHAAVSARDALDQQAVFVD